MTLIKSPLAKQLCTNCPVLAKNDDIPLIPIYVVFIFGHIYVMSFKLYPMNKKFNRLQKRSAKKQTEVIDKELTSIISPKFSIDWRLRRSAQRLRHPEIRVAVGPV